MFFVFNFAGRGLSVQRLFTLTAFDLLLFSYSVRSKLFSLLAFSVCSVGFFRRTFIAWTFGIVILIVLDSGDWRHIIVDTLLYAKIVVRLGQVVAV